jgi:3-deoxy-D-manno-octulosonate 8-phosphate phosphatase (KDO 8-P phosphatase)
MTEHNTAAGLERIKAIAMDVDGVLTDGGLLWGPNGEESKRFCFADIMGVSLARRAGLHLALISGENSPLVDRFATKLHIQHVTKGCRDKATAVRDFSSATGVDLADICFVGDDINDLGAMRVCGFSAAPSNAAAVVLAHVNFICTRSGGNGAVRELVDALFAAQHLDPLVVFNQS